MSEKKTKRRDFLFTATYAVGAVGAAAVVWPMIDQMNPDASVKALASTEVDVSGRNYWRGVCRSLIFRFPDDLEILKLDVRSYVDRSKGIIQIRSAARLGQSDLGVNLRRVEYLFNQLEKF